MPGFGEIKFGLDFIENALYTLHVIDIGCQWCLCMLNVSSQPTEEIM